MKVVKRCIVDGSLKRSSSSDICSGSDCSYATKCRCINKKIVSCLFFENRFIVLQAAATMPHSIGHFDKDRSELKQGIIIICTSVGI